MPYAGDTAGPQVRAGPKRGGGIGGAGPAIGGLVFNLLGDTVTVLVQHDYRTSIGWPIGGAMIFYLVKFARGSARDG